MNSQKLIHAYVDEMYPVEKGAPISDLDKSFQFHDVVMDKKEGNKRDIITVYFCSPKKIYQKQKKLNASAAGETPHS